MDATQAATHFVFSSFRDLSVSLDLASRDVQAAVRRFQPAALPTI